MWKTHTNTGMILGSTRSLPVSRVDNTPSWLLPCRIINHQVWGIVSPLLLHLLSGLCVVGALLLFRSHLYCSHFNGPFLTPCSKVHTTPTAVTSPCFACLPSVRCSRLLSLFPSPQCCPRRAGIVSFLFTAVPPELGLARSRHSINIRDEWTDEWSVAQEFRRGWEEIHWGLSVQKRIHQEAGLERPFREGHRGCYSGYSSLSEHGGQHTGR